MGTAYGTAPLLGWMVESKQIEPHVPVWDKTVCKEESLSIGEFRWQPERNEYVDVAYSSVLHLHPAAGCRLPAIPTQRPVTAIGTRPRTSL